MKNNLLGGAVGTALSVVGTATATNQVLETISLICTILGAIISFIVIPLITWYNKAKQDGKITKEEIQEGIQIISDGSKEVKDKLDDKSEK